jgi:hypothetical protein
MRKKALLLFTTIWSLKNNNNNQYIWDLRNAMTCKKILIYLIYLKIIAKFYLTFSNSFDLHKKNFLLVVFIGSTSMFHWNCQNLFYSLSMLNKN